MAQSIFRKESLDKVSSPEQLNDYIKVSSVGVWAILSAIIILLVCGGIWVISGTLNATVPTECITQNGTSTCYVQDTAKISVGQTVAFADGTEGTVSAVSATPVSKTDVEALYDEYTVFLISPTDWNFSVTVCAPDTSDGVQAAEITVERLHPIALVRK